MPLAEVWKNRSSRRNLLVGGALLVGATVAGLAVSRWRRSRSKYQRPPLLFGDHLPLPEAASGSYSFFFSSVDRQLAVVAGDDMTLKRIYVTEYPPKSSKSYQVVGQLPNCERVEAVTWCRQDPTRLACTATVYDDVSLPECKDWGVLDDWLTKNGISWDVLNTKRVCRAMTISQGNIQPACSYDARADLDQGQQMVWLGGAPIFLARYGGINRGFLGSQGGRKLEEVYPCGERSGRVEFYQQLAFNAQDDLLVTIRTRLSGPQSREKEVAAVLFDEKGHTQKEVPIPGLSIPDSELLMNVLLGTDGDTWLVATKKRTVLTGHIGSGEYSEIPFDAGEAPVRAMGAGIDQLVCYLLDIEFGDRPPAKIHRQEYRFGGLS